MRSENSPEVRRDYSIDCDPRQDESGHKLREDGGFAQCSQEFSGADEYLSGELAVVHPVGGGVQTHFRHGHDSL